MKNFKRFTAAVAATLIAASLSVPMAMSLPSGAADITISTATGDTATHTYEAYQIFSGTLSGTTLSDIDWGSGVGTTATVGGNTLIQAIQAISVNSSTPFSACNTAQDVADVLAGENISATDDAVTKAFADVVGKYLTTAAGTSTEDSAGKIRDLNDGYYLVQDTSTSPNSGSAKTRYILKVAGEDVTVSAKYDYPSVIKKVQEESLVDGTTETTSFAGQESYDLGDGYNDMADYDIGDDVPFKLYGTLPSTYDDYKQYYYKFTDTLGKEFTAPNSSDVKVYIDGTEVVDGYDVTVTTNADDDSSTITVTFNDLKATGDSAVTVKDGDGSVAATITSSSIITVEYTATLNENAVLGTPGQVNAVNLTYSNNPNQESGGTPDTSTTPDDGVVVFTYGIDINKVDGDQKKLADAVFAVYYLDDSGAKVYIKTDANGKYDGDLDSAPTWTDESTADSTSGTFKSVDTMDVNIKIEGLDAGDYYITELAAPDGYNKLTEDIKVTVSPTFVTGRQAWTYSSSGDTNGNALTALDIKYDKASATTLSNDANATVDSGKGVVTIENKAGSQLPSTGGIGTTLFYVGGGCIVALAGVFLITKKRANDANKD